MRVLETPLAVLLAALCVAPAAPAAPAARAGSAPAIPVGMSEQSCPTLLPLPAEYEQQRELGLRPQAPDPAATPAPDTPATLAYGLQQAAQHERDWANLCRYRAENAALAKQRRPRAVFIGDSITENWPAADPGFFTGGVVGRGISGQTSPQMLLRFYADVVALHPRVVHILAGTNDLAGNTGPTTAQDYRNNVMAMTELALANGIRVVLGAIPPADHFSWRPELRPAAQLAELNDWLRHYAAARRVTFVDYYSLLAAKDGSMRADLTHDGVHPHRAGYALMRTLAERAIE